MSDRYILTQYEPYEGHSVDEFDTFEELRIYVEGRKRWLNHDDVGIYVVKGKLSLSEVLDSETEGD